MSAACRRAPIHQLRERYAAKESRMRLILLFPSDRLNMMTQSFQKTVWKLQIPFLSSLQETGRCPLGSVATSCLFIEIPIRKYLHWWIVTTRKRDSRYLRFYVAHFDHFVNSVAFSKFIGLKKFSFH